MNNFDYNINNYSISELKEIIGIPVEEPLTYPVIHAAAAKRLSTAANNSQLFRFFSQIKDRLTRTMVNGEDEDEDEDEYDDEYEDKDEDEDEDKAEDEDEDKDED